jgi:hypothetical protein
MARIKPIRSRFAQVLPYMYAVRLMSLSALTCLLVTLTEYCRLDFFGHTAMPILARGVSFLTSLRLLPGRWGQCLSLREGQNEFGCPLYGSARSRQH